MVDQYDREMDILDKELADGTMTQKEYNREVRELEFAFSDGEREAAHEELDRRMGW